MNESIKYANVEDAYKILSPILFKYAANQLIDRDNAIDAVNSAFIKVLEWKKRNPKGHISHNIIYRLVLRQCRLLNRHQHFVSLDDPAYSEYFRNV